jgi:hypothetical protein
MRYREIAEGDYAKHAETKSKKLATTIKKVDNARRDRNKAAHQYQDTMRKADEAEKSALSR